MMNLLLNKSGKSICNLMFSTNVVTVHGLFGQVVDFKRFNKVLTADLIRRGVVEPKTFSAGLPNHKDGKHTLEYDTAAYVKQLAKDIDEAVKVNRASKADHNFLIGHSLGGTIGYLEACSGHHKYDGVILIDITPPVVYYDSSNENFESEQRTMKVLRRNKIKEVLSLLYMTEALLKPLIYFELVDRERITYILDKFPVWKRFNAMEKRYIMRAFEPRVVNGKAQLWNINIKALRNYFHVGYMLGRHQCTFSGPTLCISCRSSGFASPGHLNRASERIPHLEIEHVDGGHWVLANYNHLQQVSAISADWISKIVC